MTKRFLGPLILVVTGAAATGGIIASTSAGSPGTRRGPEAPVLVTAVQKEASENWAGYIATPNGAGGFSAVSASWTQPAINCTASGSDAYSSLWVGLGGGGQQSEALEQIGTQGNCSSAGDVSYYSWYELVPSAPVKLDLIIRPGDRVYARTAVSGDKVTLELVDYTTGKSWSRTLTMTDATPDTSTAEWVAEAPSACANGTLGMCTPLPLADFGTATFTDAHATAGGHTGPIDDSRWTDTQIELIPSASTLLGGGYGGWDHFSESGNYGNQTSSQGAAPGSLRKGGTSFSVTYGTSLNLGGSGSTQTQPQGYGNPSGADGYGYGGYGYGAGSPYGYSGSGSGGYSGSGWGDYAGGGWGGYAGGGWGGSGSY